QGRLAWRGTGEADYAGLEPRVRALLQERQEREGAGLAESGSETAVRSRSSGCEEATAEVFLGHRRGTLANSQRYAPGVARAYVPSGVEPPEGQPMLSGSWMAWPDGVSRGTGPAATLSLVYRAREVYIVLHPLGPGMHAIEVTQDGAPLGPAV